MTVKKETTTEIKFSDHESTFSLSFSSFYRLFSAKANFFCKFFLLLNFFSFFREETNKFWCPEGGYNIVFVPKVELCCPAGEFLS